MRACRDLAVEEVGCPDPGSPVFQNEIAQLAHNFIDGPAIQTA